MTATRQFEITWKASPNYFKGRNGKRIIAIVDHITAGLMPGCLSWMQNSASKASANYLVGRTGRIYQMVKDEDSAWHAGEVKKPSWRLYDGTNPNRYTIGIEHEGKGGDALTEAQYQATLWLHRQLIAKWGIPIDADHIIGHYRIDSVNRPNCPGPGFPWDRLFVDLRNGVIDLALEKWMVEGGQAAVKALEEKGLLLDSARWGKESELEKPFPTYLAWMMLDRLANYKGGK